MLTNDSFNVENEVFWNYHLEEFSNSMSGNKNFILRQDDKRPLREP